MLWTSNAEAKLAETWLHAPDRRHVTQAADKLDQQLGWNAHLVGESRAGLRRIAHESPLGIIFSVNEQDRVVSVLDVWLYHEPDDE